MNHLPFYIPAFFAATSFLATYLFYKASGKNIRLVIVIAGWVTLQSALAVTGFFTVTDTVPPRLILLIALPLIGMVTAFSSAKGKSFLESFDVRQLTLLHTVRLGIELVLFWLFLYGTMPRLMTFEGRNFDLVSGVTAPLVYYFGFVKQKIGVKTIIAWNFICLAILLFTVGNALLSAPTPFQKFGFDQPTIAVLYFPFVWLPGTVVPLVIFSHLASIRLLLRAKRQRVEKKAAPTLIRKQIA